MCPGPGTETRRSKTLRRRCVQEGGARSSFPTVSRTLGHAGPAYGVPHAATIDAIKLAGRLEGLVLDPVYSGKSLAGLIALIGEGRWTPTDNVVFIHTGGAPALFAYREALGVS
jgi:L-cysteate sulfo-lyase